jgi:hypothetical protein
MMKTESKILGGDIRNRRLDSTKSVKQSSEMANSAREISHSAEIIFAAFQILPFLQKADVWTVRCASALYPLFVTRK